MRGWFTLAISFFLGVLSEFRAGGTEKHGGLMGCCVGEQQRAYLRRVRVSLWMGGWERGEEWGLSLRVLFIANWFLSF